MKPSLFLAVDIGNTNTVLGLFDGKELKYHFRVSTHGTRTIDETWALIFGLLQAQNLDHRRITGVALSSVVPDRTFIYQKLAEAYLHTQAQTITHRSYPRLPVTYPDPDSLGADRFCNAVAAARLYGSPVVVIDFGTATSFDIVNGAGEFVGGVIAPGMDMSALLHSRAAKLPKVELEFPPRVIGDNTVHALQSGILWGGVAMIEGLLERIFRELGEKGAVVATGGFARMVSRRTPVIDEVNPYLVLEGIRIIHESS